MNKMSLERMKSYAACWNKKKVNGEEMHKDADLKGQRNKENETVEVRAGNNTPL